MPSTRTRLMYVPLPIFVPQGGMFADLGSHLGLASEGLEPQNQDLILHLPFCVHNLSTFCCIISIFFFICQ